MCFSETLWGEFQELIKSVFETPVSVRYSGFEVSIVYLLKDGF